VNAASAKNAVINLYDNLFTKENPEDMAQGEDFTQNLNQESLKIITNAKVESATEELSKNGVFQFERKGYFVRDISAKEGELVFSRTATLKDTWAKIQNS
jgi:glutaminyl-tRNA synthetase